MALITCTGNKRLSSPRAESSTAFAHPMAHQPELLRVPSFGPFSVLLNSLAAPHAHHQMGLQMDNHSGPSFSSARHTVHHKTLCERHGQSSSSIAPIPQKALLALEYAPVKASEHSIWNKTLNRSRFELEPSGIATLISGPFSTTRPMHSSGYMFTERKPALAMQHGTILSSAAGVNRSASAMAQSFMSPRGTLSLGEIAVSHFFD